MKHACSWPVGFAQRHSLALLLTTMMALSLVVAVPALAGGPANPMNYARVVLPSGTVVPVQLDAPLSSKTSRQGDKFSATIKTGSDDAGLPQGARIEGVVQEATPAADGQPGALDVDFRRIVFPNGRSQAITASLYSLDGKAVKRTDGRLVASADSKSKDRLKFIGIGAGAGLLIGVLTKGSTLQDVLLGAGAGYLYNELQNKKPGDVNLKEGAAFGVRFDRELAFNADEASYSRQTSASPVLAAHRSPVTGFGSDIAMFIDDQQVRFDSTNRPYTRNGVVFVPLAATGRAASFDYRYDSRNRVIYARGDSIRLALGSRTATVNGERRTLPAAAEQRGGVTFVPMQLIGWAANGSVGWDASSRTITLNTNSGQ